MIRRARYYNAALILTITKFDKKKFGALERKSPQRFSKDNPRPA